MRQSLQLAAGAHGARISAVARTLVWLSQLSPSICLCSCRTCQGSLATYMHNCQSGMKSELGQRSDHAMSSGDKARLHIIGCNNSQTQNLTNRGQVAFSSVAAAVRVGACHLKRVSAYRSIDLCGLHVCGRTRLAPCRLTHLQPKGRDAGEAH